MRDRKASVVVVAAAALGIGVTGAGLARALRTTDVSAPDRVDATFAELRPRLRPGERVAVVLRATAGAAATARPAALSRAQYALAPAIVAPLWAEDCLAAGDACRPVGGRVVVPAAEAEVAALLAERLGGGVERVGGVLVLRGDGRGEVLGRKPGDDP